MLAGLENHSGLLSIRSRKNQLPILNISLRLTHELAHNYMQHAMFRHCP
jgi:hypothetical protein